MRLKAYDLNLLLNTHLMVFRPLEKFLRAFKVERMKNFGSQKVVKTKDFQSPRGSGEKTRQFFQLVHQNKEY